MSQLGFAFVGNRCTGCKTCMLACKDRRDLTSEINFRTVYEYGGGTCRINDEGLIENASFAYYVSSACNHCSDPACVAVCPTGAMGKDEETGLVGVDEGRCIGCGYCAMSCPYGNPAVDHEKGHSVKCDGCADRIAEGKRPTCVEACPLRALDFGPIDELRKKYDSVTAIAPMPDPKYTSPNVAIVAPNNARPVGSDEGRVLNLEEVI